MCKTFVVFLLSIFLCLGCTTLPDVDTSNNIEFANHNKILKNIQEYQINGKVAFKDEKKSFTAYISLAVIDNNTFVLYLTSITGSTLLKVHKKQNITTITDNDGNEYSNTDVNQLVKRLTGFSIPCSELPLILKGEIINDNIESLTLNDFGLPKSLVIKNFLVNYTKYTELSVNKLSERTQKLIPNKKTIVLPQKIEVQNETIKMRINLNKWEL
ncbi:MAG: lipoprotein insertase outer membrane protein LolB [Succinivibrionaceae bacterium]